MSRSNGLFGGVGGLALFVVLALLVVAIGYSEFARQRSDQEARQRDAALAEEIAEVRNEARAAFTSLIPQEVVARANPSVYAIVVNGRLFGTAFVVDRERGVLATAAHVADLLPLDEEDAQITILNRFNGSPIPVRTARNHAGYGAFRKLIEDFQPIRPNTPILTPQVLPLRDLAFDAALLTVDPLDPASGENRLGPDLPVAPEETLVNLGAGAPIAVIGFPYDTLDDSFQADSAISRAERGVVSALIAPLDNAATSGDPIIANLIIHRLSTANGSSGSPVVNAAGEVVGIHTHGVESLSGNADGAAQRADVLQDLLEEGRDQRRLDDVFVPAWTRLLAFWRSAKDVLPWSYYLEREKEREAEDILISEFDLASPAPFTTTLQSLEFGKTQDNYLLEAPDLAITDAGLGDAGQDGAVAAERDGERPVFRINKRGEFSTGSFMIDRSKNSLIYAFDYSLRRRVGFCRLVTYWRKRGDARLTIQPIRASTELFFPAIENGGLEEYELVFQRIPDCDPASYSFEAGVMSWEAGPAPDIAEQIVQAVFPPSDHAQLSTPEPASVAKILNTVQLRCILPGTKIDNRKCGDPEFIEAEVHSPSEQGD